MKIDFTRDPKLLTEAWLSTFGEWNKTFLKYFGERKSDNCKQCSAKSCRKEEKLEVDIQSEIKNTLQKGALNAYQIGLKIGISNELIVIALHEMLDENDIGLNESNQFYLK